MCPTSDDGMKNLKSFTPFRCPGREKREKRTRKGAKRRVCKESMLEIRGDRGDRGIRFPTRIGEMTSEIEKVK